jgi:hypothetical protein
MVAAASGKALEKSVKPARQAHFMREILDFILEIAHGLLWTAMRVYHRMRRA